ncbi:hypothetical protein GCM10009809_33560 [Isoptericola hypogeus]|uniref:Uncharacterized protein n=1 Tax=Isoptericola hypogeus TaxID=300179 RepID=A0ABN2JQI7_9MICO
MRELLVASTTLSIAAAAHLFGGGSLPGSVAGWVVTVALTLPVAVWTARRRLTLPRLLPAMAVLQVVQHTALSFMATAGASAASSTGPGTGSAAAAGPAAHAGQPAPTPGSLAFPTGLDPTHLHHGDDPRAGALMLAAHAVAVLVTALLLAAGDRAAGSLLVWLGAVVLLVAGALAAPVGPGRPRRPARGTSWVPRTWLGLAGLRLRGPPRVAAPA